MRICALFQLRLCCGPTGSVKAPSAVGNIFIPQLARWSRGDSLDVQFYGKDAETLKSAAEDLKTAVARFPIVSAVEDDLSYDKEEMILELTPQGQVLGFTIDGLGACCVDD